MKIILYLTPSTTAKCLSLLSQPNLSLLTRRRAAGPAWEWSPSLSWWRGARAASPSGTWTSATCCRLSTWARAATARVSGSCWCSTTLPSSATSAASSAWCTCPRCWRNWTKERRMDGRCSWCRWEHSLTKQKNLHSEHPFPLHHFDFPSFFLLSLLFLAPKGDTIIRPVSTCIQGSFFFLDVSSTSLDVMRKKKLRTDCATCCILSEEGDRPSIPKCWHLRRSWGWRKAGCFSRKEDPPVTSLCFLCVFVLWLGPLCCWYGWGFTVTPPTQRGR